MQRRWGDLKLRKNSGSVEELPGGVKAKLTPGAGGAFELSVVYSGVLEPS